MSHSVGTSQRVGPAYTHIKYPSAATTTTVPGNEKETESTTSHSNHSKRGRLSNWRRKKLKAAKSMVLDSPTTDPAASQNFTMTQNSTPTHNVQDNTNPKSSPYHSELNVDTDIDRGSMFYCDTMSRHPLPKSRILLLT